MRNMHESSQQRSVMLLALALVVIVLVAAVGAPRASAASAGPAFSIDSFATPTDFSAEHNANCLYELEGREEIAGLACDTYQVSVTDTGSTPSDGTPITIADELPQGLTVRSIKFTWSGAKRLNGVIPGFYEGGTNLNVALSEQGFTTPCTAVPLRCTLPDLGVAIDPDETLEMLISVTVQPGAPEALLNEVSFSGGGAPATSTRSENANTTALGPFGVSAFDSAFTTGDGAPEEQAGGHPYEYTTRIDLNNDVRDTPQGYRGDTAVEDLRDVVVDLPVGFLGSAVAAPTCTAEQLIGPGSCPPDTAVGHITTEGAVGTDVDGPLFNMVAPPGVTAEFGYTDALKVSHRIYASIAPTPQGYVVRASTREIPQVPLRDIVVTLYGDPSARTGAASAPVAQFTNPTNCSGQPLETTLHIDSWQHPGANNTYGAPDFADPNWVSASSRAPAVTGCNLLQFAPALSAQPDTTRADAPTGLTFGLSVPQSEAPGTLATPPLRDATVTLPAGMTVDPSSANGLEACSEEQIGFLGATITDFTPNSPTCPEGSNIGTVEVTSPLLASPLTGSVYLATQNANPFHSLLAGYIVIDDPTTGVIVKIAGELKTDPNTGQITGVFDENPQLPFSDLKLRFTGGNQGLLATPQSCGVFTTTSDLMPWSAPDSGPDATPSSSFPIISNCSFGFAPAFSAGTVSNQAGGFSPFTLTIARQDGEQHLTGVDVTMPSGVLGTLTGIPLCGEAEANAGTCEAASLVGETSVTAGVGPNPYAIKGGRVYLTGPYNGGPFGLSIVVPAVAGPFDLGDIVVRASIRINPITSQISVVSDPLPLMVNSVEGLKSGIPADIRSVSVTINRSNFTFNSTSCEPTSVLGTLAGAQGATAPASSHYQASDCANLKFTPTVKLTTGGKASKANGASLAFTIAYPKGAQGQQAWFNETKFTIPRQLPARLTTLQKACLAKVFETERQNCPAASIIGHVTVHTPIVPVPLVGPLYFVSYGDAAFPNVEIPLEGYGIKVLLTGETYIHDDVTSATFRNLPDVPFESIEVDVPTGPYSEFGANLPHESYSFCGRRLKVATLLKASNGLEIDQETPVTITGCGKAKALTKRQKLTAALKMCHKKHGKSKASCERDARNKYGVRKANKKH